MKRLFLIASMTMALMACGSEEESGTEPSATAAAPDESPAADPAPAADEPAGDEGGGGGSPCARARDCCNAYVSAMGAGVTTDQACAGIAGAEAAGAAGEASCNQMISSWRQSLTAMNRDVPAACQ